jgi:uncharacterized DUF497 family protein
MDVRHHIASNDFIWNAAKAAMNARKHGVRFEDAATVFADPLFVLTDASRSDEATKRRGARRGHRFRSIRQVAVRGAH